MPEVKNIGRESDRPPDRLTGATLGLDILRYLPGTLGPAAGLLVFAAVFTRLFETDEYGRYSLVFSVGTLAAALFGQWLVQSINRYVAASGDLVEARSLVGASLSAIILAIALVAVLTAVPLWLVAGPEWRPFIVPGTLMVLAWSLFQPLLAVYQATRRVRANSAVRIAQIALRLGLALFIVFVVWRHPAGLVLASALGAGLLAIWMWRHLGLGIIIRFSRETLRGLARWSRYGFPMIPWFACSILLAVGDRYLIQWLRSSAELGIYAANYGIVAGGAGLLAAPIRLAAHPFLMRAWGRREEVEASAWLSRIVAVLVFAMVVVVGPTVVFAPDLARIILGQEFREGYMVMPIALGGIAVWQLGLYLHKPFEFHERTGIMMGLATAAVVVNLGLNVLFIPGYGYIAAAWTTLASYGVYAVATGVLGRKLLPWRIEWRTLVAPTAAFCAAMVLLAWLRRWLEPVVGYGAGLAVSFVVLAAILGVAAWQMARMLAAPPATGSAPRKPGGR